MKHTFMKWWKALTKEVQEQLANNYGTNLDEITNQEIEEIYYNVGKYLSN